MKQLLGSRAPASRLAALSSVDAQTQCDSLLRLAIRARMTRSLIERRFTPPSWEAAEQRLSGSRRPASRVAALSDSSLQTASSDFVLRLANRARMRRSLIEQRYSAAS